MKKRLFAIALSLCMTLSLLPTAAFAAETERTVSTADELTTAIQEGGIVILGGNISVDKTIGTTKDVILDLNGHTLTGDLSQMKGANAVIDITGLTLTIQDTSDRKNGKINSDEYGLSATENGTIVVNSGTVESGFAALSGNNTTGDMNFIVNGGVLTSTQSEAIYMPGQSKLEVNDGVINGGISARMGQITINGGEINGMTGEGDAMSDYWNYSGSAWIGDAIYIWGGTYTSNNQYGNTANVTINGGTINGKNHRAVVVYNIGNNYDQNVNVNIKGGEIDGSIAVDSTYPQDSSKRTHIVTTNMVVTGGTFSTDPSAYVANGYGIVKDNGFHVYQECQATVNYGVADKENYTFNVYKDAYMELPKFEGEFTTYNKGYSPYCWLIDGKEYFPGDEYQIPGKFTMTLKWVEISEDMPVTKVETSPGETAAEAKTEGKSDEVADAMNKAADALKTSNAVDQDTLTNSAEKAVNVDQVLADNQQAIQEVAKATNGNKAPDAVDYVPVTLVVEPYMKIEVTDANVGTAGASVTMDITPMVKVTVTTSPDNVGNQTEENTKVLKDEPMAIKASKAEPIEMTLPVPAILENSDIYVQHKGYEYDTQKNGGSVTFTNPHGFSEFSMSNLSQSVTSITKDGNTTRYVDLGLAIDEAEAGTTLYVGSGAHDKSYTTGKGGKTVTLTKSPVLNDFEVTINGTKYTLTDAGVSFTTPRASSGGGGGSASTGYTVTAPSAKNGSVSVTPKNASKGDTVTVTVKADKGYELSKLTVTDKDGKTVKLTDKGNGKYTFTMPGSKVEVKAEFVEITTEPSNPFRDVNKNAYYYKQVLWAVEKGITSGVSANEFAPEAACTRGQMVTFLWKAAGSPEVSGALAFDDVSSDAYYAKAVRWAAQQGITSGTSAGVFSPDAPCTRGQMAMFLYAYAKTPAVTGSVPFGDVASGDYFNTAVLWAVNNGITSGTSSNTYSPASVCTRGQMVVFLYQLLNK